MAKRRDIIPKVGEVRHWVYPLDLDDKFVVWKIAKTTPASDAICEIRYLDGRADHCARYFLQMYSRVIE